MKLVFLFGNSAVGKMTVGQALMARTGLRLFHNHMTIEPVLEIFGQYHQGAIDRMRQVIFEEFAASGAYGMIFTYMWAFDQPSDWNYVEKIKNIFAPYRTEFYYVELVADLNTRIARNQTENRLRRKPSKQNLEFSAHLLRSMDEQHRFESLEGEIPFDNYMKIDNTNLSPDEVAQMIQERFAL